MSEQEYIKKISKYSDKKLLNKYHGIITGDGQMERFLNPTDCRILTLMEREMERRKIKPIHLMNAEQYSNFIQDEDFKVENKLHPNNLKIKKDGDGLKSIIVDVELDAIEVKLTNDDCVQLETDGLTYIMLSTENLNQLKKLIKEAQKFYNEKPKS